MRYVCLFLCLVLASACRPQGTQSDSQAVQSLMPNINGYTRSQTSNIIDAMTAAGAGGALLSGNPAVAAAVARADTVLDCLEASGTIGANTYVETVQSGLIPEAGAVIIINQTRLNQNALACFLTAGTESQRGFSAQNIDIRPCAEGGNFTYQSNDYAYAYVGVGDRLCGFFSQHFGNLKR